MTPGTGNTERLKISFPSGDGEYAQDEEWCEVRLDGSLRRIRFHDYDEIYAIQGLYEQLFYEKLRCDSPRTVCALLAEVLEAREVEPDVLDILELGAGNGMVAEQLRTVGAGSIVGVDIIEEAAQAAERDRPGVYDDYLVLDLTDLAEADRRRLCEHPFNCLVTVAALGFGDIPPAAFGAAYDCIEPGGLVVFNIKEDFIRDGDTSGFSQMVRRAFAEGTLGLVAERRYQHRLSTAGEPLHYMALVAEKRGSLPESD